MDSYLSIAKKVLSETKVPLSSHSIIKLAYKYGVVPKHLYGKTQHKTLGARLSEEILINSFRSEFFRTEPGKFFLRKFLKDKNIPDKFKTEFSARRRKRELSSNINLTISSKIIKEKFDLNEFIPKDSMLELLQDNNAGFETNSKNSDNISVIVFAIVRRDYRTLTYRIGKYRSEIDAFFKKKSIGFITNVDPCFDDLFGRNDFGITQSGMSALIYDLDIPVMDYEDLSDNASLQGFMVSQDGKGREFIVSFITFQCPEWFEPTKKRLAINDMKWEERVELSNNFEDFEPWSRSIFPLINSFA